MLVARTIRHLLYIVRRTKFESQSNEQAAGGAGRAASAGETRHLAQHFHRSTTCRLADTAAQAAPRQQ